jgi:hypothetical protein
MKNQPNFVGKTVKFRVDEKICGTLWISGGIPKCRGTQFENH